MFLVNLWSGDNILMQFFICDPERIQEKLRVLEGHGISEDGWVLFYTDTENYKWALSGYHYRSEGDGVEILYRLPAPDTATLIEIALTTTDQYDVFGAALELKSREKKNGEDFRQQLIDRLYALDLDNLSAFDRQRISTIIYESELFEGRNRRDVLGKHATEIKADAAYYGNIARKALAILIKINQD